MTDFDNRAVSKFLTLENVRPKQIHNRMTVLYMPRLSSALPTFVEAEEALKFEPRQERPSEAVCEENCRSVEDIVNCKIASKCTADS